MSVKYIAFNKGTIDKLPISEKRVKYYHKEIKGLHLDIRPSGQKAFRINYKMNGYNFTYTIGEYPEINPAVAVDRGRDIKLSLSKGINPQQDKTDKRKEYSYREFYIERYLPSQLSKRDIKGVNVIITKNKLGKEVVKFEGKVERKVANIMETYNAHIHDAPISKKKLSDITPIDIASFLRKIDSKAMFNRLVREMRAVFNTSDISPNPVARALKTEISMKPIKARTVKLSNDDFIKLGRALTKIRSGYMQDNGFFYQPQRIQADIIEILVYEGLRPDEVYSMKWTSIIDGIYHANTKTGDKEIPLTQQTMRIINSIERVSPYVFPSPVNINEPIQSVRKVWLKALELAGINNDYQIKDLRSTYSSRATKRFDLFVSSKLTNHSSTKVVEKHYSDLDTGERKSKKDKIANEFENLLSGGGKVVKLG